MTRQFDEASSQGMAKAQEMPRLFSPSEELSRVRRHIRAYIVNMYCANDMAITRRFIGFVSEVIRFLPISRTLRVLVVCPAATHPHAGCEFAAIFFAPGVRGVAIALWAENSPGGIPIPNALLRLLDGSAKGFRELTAPEEIQTTLTALYSALEAELRGDPKMSLMLTSAFKGPAFDLAATAAIQAHMPLSGNSSLANYLAAFPIVANAPFSDTSATAPPQLLQAVNRKRARSSQKPLNRRTQG